MTLLTAHSGEIPIDYRQFVLEPREIEPPRDISTLYGAGMLHAEARSVGVSSAVDSYPAVSNLRIELHSQSPELENLDAWDAAAEISFQFAETAYPCVTLTTDPEPLSDDLGHVEVAPGQYRIRAYGRKVGEMIRSRPQSHIDRHPELDDEDNLIVADRLEDLLVQLWPSSFDSTDIPSPKVLKEHEEYVHLVI